MRLRSFSTMMKGRQTTIAFTQTKLRDDIVKRGGHYSNTARLSRSELTSAYIIPASAFPEGVYNQLERCK